MQQSTLEKFNEYKHFGIDDRYTESVNNKKYLDIRFQDGSMAANGKNGALIEDVLIVAYAKLNEYNQELPSRYSSLALTNIEEAILWLTARRAEREYRQVDGTYQE